MTRSEAADTLCALVAIKSPEHCKSRLAGTLPESERRALVRSMLSNVLDAAHHARCVHRVVVVSPERGDVPKDTVVLADHGESLNAALMQAQAQLHIMGHAATIILPADLPRLRASEIEAFVQAGRRSGFAIAPDRAHRGTNALFLRTGTPFTFRFGPDSLRLHLREAADRDLRACVVDLPGLAFDVDEPADLEALDLRALAARREDNLREEAAWQTQTRL
jgi:2-phospho-L-lactate/phosphoenolpyruvate guanylyltransferase